MQRIRSYIKSEKLKKYFRALLIRSAVCALAFWAAFAVSQNATGKRLIKKHLFYEVDIVSASEKMYCLAHSLLPL